MNKNNFISAIILFLFCILISGYVYKNTYQNKKNDNSRNDWQNDNDWGNPSKDNDQLNPPAVVPPITKTPTSYEEAIQIAKQSNKNILIFFTSDKCSHCVTMKKNTFTNQQVKDKINTMVFYEVNSTKDREVFQKYAIRVAPSYYIIDGNENVLKSGRGALGPHEFLAWMNSEKTNFFSWLMKG